MCVSLRLSRVWEYVYVSGCLKCFVTFEVFLGVCLFKTQSCLGICICFWVFEVFCGV